MGTDISVVSELNEEVIMSKTYIIRGQKIMLDFDIADIYGYETKNFNRQVKNNIEKFDDDFRFQLSKEEYNEILRCKNCTARGIFLCKKIIIKPLVKTKIPVYNILK